MTETMISIEAFSNELQKIAEDSASSPRRPVNREQLKQFAKDTAIVAAGSGLGYGLGKLTIKGLKRYGRKLPKNVRRGLIVGLPVAGGAGGLAISKMREKEQDRRLEEAYQRGAKK